MIKVQDRFDRPANSALEIACSNRSSTDTLGALHQWSTARPGRTYTPLVDKDEYLDAEIGCDPFDGDSGPQLGGLCDKYGVRLQLI